MTSCDEREEGVDEHRLVGLAVSFDGRYYAIDLTFVVDVHERGADRDRQGTGKARVAHARDVQGGAERAHDDQRASAPPFPLPELPAAGDRGDCQERLERIEDVEEGSLLEHVEG